MKSDPYTKAVLTIIAVLLTVIACRTVISPETTASAQGSFAGVQFTSTYGTNTFFDTRTGEVWVYHGNDEAPGQLIVKFKVTKLGEPLTVSR